LSAAHGYFLLRVRRSNHFDEHLVGPMDRAQIPKTTRSSYYQTVIKVLFDIDVNNYV